MDRQKVKRSAEQYVNGAAFMTTKELAGWLGVGRTTARGILSQIRPAYKHHYFIPEILDVLEKRC